MSSCSCFYWPVPHCISSTYRKSSLEMPVFCCTEFDFVFEVAALLFVTNAPSLCHLPLCPLPFQLTLSRQLMVGRTSSPTAPTHLWNCKERPKGNSKKCKKSLGTFTRLQFVLLCDTASVDNSKSD